MNCSTSANLRFCKKGSPQDFIVRTLELRLGMKICLFDKIHSMKYENVCKFGCDLIKWESGENRTIYLTFCNCQFIGEMRVFILLQLWMVIINMAFSFHVHVSYVLSNECLWRDWHHKSSIYETFFHELTPHVFSNHSFEKNFDNKQHICLASCLHAQIPHELSRNLFLSSCNHK